MITRNMVRCLCFEMGRFQGACLALKRQCFAQQVWALERAGIAPKGSSEVSSFLETGADALVEGGKCDSWLLPFSRFRSRIVEMQDRRVSICSNMRSVCMGVPVAAMLRSAHPHCWQSVRRKQLFTPMYFFLVRKPVK